MSQYPYFCTDRCPNVAWLVLQSPMVHFLLWVATGGHRPPFGSFMTLPSQPHSPSILVPVTSHAISTFRIDAPVVMGMIGLA